MVSACTIGLPLAPAAAQQAFDCSLANLGVHHNMMCRSMLQDLENYLAAEGSMSA